MGANRGSHEHRRAGSMPTQAIKRRIAAAVSERDNGICQLCGEPVDESLRGTERADAPSLDHIVSFSDGGAFTVANLRLAHLLCNQQRAGHNLGRALYGSRGQ